MKKRPINTISFVMTLVILLGGFQTAIAQSTTVIASGEPLLDPTGIAVSPNGETIYVTDLFDRVLSVPATGGTPTVIASGPLVNHTRGIVVSPDGATLYIAGYYKNNILSISASGGSPTILASGYPLINPHGIEISPDGSKLYIADVGAHAILELPVTGGVPTTIWTGPQVPYAISDVVVSPDGNTLYIASYGTATITSLSLLDGTLTVLASGPPLTWSANLALSVDGATLYITDSGEQEFYDDSAIYQLPVTGGEPTLVLVGSPLHVGGMIAVSPDGRALYAAEPGFMEIYNWGPPYEPGTILRINLVEQVDVNIDPDTLNLKSSGGWVTAYIEVYGDYNVTDINLSTLFLEGSLPISDYPFEIGDYDNNGIADLMVKFDRQVLIEYLAGTIGDVSLSITGTFSDGTPFEGSDAIAVINPRKK
ncbi:MAG: hypothetical protein AB1894_17325 [Chloroflexota bacterium]